MNYQPANGAGIQSTTKPVRAAIYTRVSTDESLGMEFNSLDAQREACAAYIASQRHEGWEVIGTQYDDGGYSGGSMKRPALQRMIEDIKAGLINTIVVYKIDRLTRSLADFSRIVDVLDAHEASFVSVTQAFNTTNSMGRLTLNVLLSFAQFEREVGAERVRDKIASSKKKGIWMGGVVPLGYDVCDRKLVVNASEAKTVRLIFERYQALRSVPKLEVDLKDRGIVSKRHIGEGGTARGAKPLARGALYNLLQNVTYVGKVAHKGEHYDGQHKAILDQTLFDTAQSILADNRAKKKHGAGAREPSILAGLLFDEGGGRLTPSHTTKGSKRFRYYVAREHGERTQRFRIPAHDLEQTVLKQLCSWLDDAHGVEASLQQNSTDAATTEALLHAARRTSEDLQAEIPTQARELCLALIERVIVASDHLKVTLKPQSLCRIAKLPASNIGCAPVVLRIACHLVRRSREVRLALTPELPSGAEVDPALVKLIVKAHVARSALFAGTGESLAEIARSQGYETHYFAVLVKLGFLEPAITEAILDGHQPMTLDRQRLARMRALPMEWEKQKLELGFDGIQ